MISFLEEIAKKYASKGRSLENYTFVLPSKRAGVFLKNFIKAEVSTTCFAPQITSIESWVSEIAALGYMSREQQLFSLYEVYSDLFREKKEAFSDFYPWAITLLNDYSEIDQYLVDARKLFNYLAEVKQLSHWSLQGEQSDLIKGYLYFWNSLLPLYERFTEKTLQSGAATQGMVYRKATENKKAYLEQHKGKKIVFVGFNALSRSEEDLFQFFLESGLAEIHWDIDTYTYNDKDHDAGYFIRTYISQWRYYERHPKPVFSVHLSREKNIEMIGLPMNVSQANYVGGILEGLSKEELEHTAVVLSDEQALNTLLNTLPEQIQSPNITMGYPMAQTDVASLLKLLFELQGSTTSTSFFTPYVFKVLLHPLIKKYCHKTTGDYIDDLIFDMRKSNLTYWNLTSLTALNPQLKTLFEVLFTTQLKNPKQFLVSLKSLLKLLVDVLGKNNRELQSNALYLTELIERLSLWVDQYAFIDSLIALEKLFDQRIATMQNYFKGEALEGLQIMGMLESRNLDFEQVIITHVNEGILPGGKKFNSHLPYELKCMYGLPTYKERDAVFTYHFYRLLQRTKKVWITYNTEPDVLEGGEPSRFLAQLNSDQVLSKFSNEVKAAPSLKSTSLKLLTIEKDVADIEKLKEIFKRKLSPSALTAYIRNPIDFYHRYILGIKEVLDFDQMMAHNVFGTIVHDSLEDLYRPLIGSELNPQNLKFLLKRLDEVVDHFYEKHYVSPRKNEGKNIVAYEVIKEYIRLRIADDSKDSETKTIELIALEQEFNIPLQLSNGVVVNAHGKVDRIEKQNGIYCIVDYKTGKVEPRELNLKDWEELTQNKAYSKIFQLLFYAMLFDSEYQVELLNAGIYSFKNLKDGLMKYKEDKNVTINSETLKRFKEQLTVLIEEILNPEIPFQEKEV